MHLKGKTALAFDPSYILKAGKKTPGVGYFWSGVAGRAKWGLEFCLKFLFFLKESANRFARFAQWRFWISQEEQRFIYLAFKP